MNIKTQHIGPGGGLNGLTQQSRVIMFLVLVPLILLICSYICFNAKIKHGSINPNSELEGIDSVYASLTKKPSRGFVPLVWVLLSSIILLLLFSFHILIGIISAHHNN